ncbi:hypothetical protein Xant_04475 [Xanthomonas cissicola]|uniref:Integrase n=1 Tax=Xanthomonas cissicola TaxID=86186 RepID=A0ABX3M252_9XANT|nr:hypothetical protein Xant_04475 [Xanthomonas cissicola]
MILYMMRRVVSRICGALFRASLNEMGGWTPDAIESALTHKMPGVRGIYNQAQYLDERRKMMQAWGDYTQTLRLGSALPLVKEVA